MAFPPMLSSIFAQAYLQSIDIWDLEEFPGTNSHLML